MNDEGTSISSQLGIRSQNSVGSLPPNVEHPIVVQQIVSCVPAKPETKPKLIQGTPHFGFPFCVKNDEDGCPSHPVQLDSELPSFGNPFPPPKVNNQQPALPALVTSGFSLTSSSSSSNCLHVSASGPNTSTMTELKQCERQESYTGLTLSTPTFDSDVEMEDDITEVGEEVSGQNVESPPNTKDLVENYSIGVKQPIVSACNRQNDEPGCSSDRGSGHELSEDEHGDVVTAPDDHDKSAAEVILKTNVKVSSPLAVQSAASFKMLQRCLSDKSFTNDHLHNYMKADSHSVGKESMDKESSQEKMNDVLTTNANKLDTSNEFTYVKEELCSKVKNMNPTPDSRKVDRFGRLVRDDITSTDSDYSDDQWKSRGIRNSRSQYLPNRKSGRQNFRRRSNNRSRSRSWSPRNRKSRSRSPYYQRALVYNSGRRKRQNLDCFYYMRGNCYRESSCRFNHPDGTINHNRSAQRNMKQNPPSRTVVISETCKTGKGSVVESDLSDDNVTESEAVPLLKNRKLEDSMYTTVMTMDSNLHSGEGISHKYVSNSQSEASHNITCSMEPVTILQKSEISDCLFESRHFRSRKEDESNLSYFSSERRLCSSPSKHATAGSFSRIPPISGSGNDYEQTQPGRTDSLVQKTLPSKTQYPPWTDSAFLFYHPHSLTPMSKQTSSNIVPGLSHLPNRDTFQMLLGSCSGNDQGQSQVTTTSNIFTDAQCMLSLMIGTKESTAFKGESSSMVSVIENTSISYQSQSNVSGVGLDSFQRSRPLICDEHDNDMTLSNSLSGGQDNNSVESRLPASSNWHSGAGNNTTVSGTYLYNPCNRVAQSLLKGDQDPAEFTFNKPESLLNLGNAVLNPGDKDKACSCVAAPSPVVEPISESTYAEVCDFDVASRDNTPDLLNDDPIKSPGKKKRSSDTRSSSIFKAALAEFVKEVLKPSWRQGNMSKEIFKIVVKKSVDKVGKALKGRLPKSKAKIEQYIDSSRGKLTKLVMDYVDKYAGR